MLEDDEILSLEDGWLIHLDEPLGGKLTAREKRKIARHYSRLKLKPPDFEEHCKSWRRYRQCKGDIVSGGWDDPADFSWWKDAFKVLKPPRDDDNGD